MRGRVEATFQVAQPFAAIDPTEFRPASPGFRGDFQSEE
jgi:hypothetical protein